MMSYLFARIFSGLLVTSLVVLWPACQGGKVLVVPVEGSHWVNMDIVIQALHSKGHEVTVLRTTKSWYIKEVSPYYSSVTVTVTEGFDNDFIRPILKNIMDIERGKASMLNFVNLQVEMITALYKSHELICKMASNMFKDKALMTSLEESQFDVVLTDPAWGGGILLAHHLQIPLVYNVRWITTGEGHLAIAPSPLSYIPMMGSGFSDRMTFPERVKNMLFFLLMEFQQIFLTLPQYQAVCDEFFDPAVNFRDLLRGADLWLMRVDFVFEFPRPTMPNVIYIGGFQCKPAKPLPQDLEEFVQSSGEHGVIIMSLGTFVSEVPSDITQAIAAAFAQLPQKVIWRHIGERPATLGNNTLLVDWMPQNDLLGHPKTRVFVAHGGTNGLQEALFHGVPVVGIPLFFDQYDNLLRLNTRGAAKILSVATVDKDNHFLSALQEVLHEPSYRMNMQRLSRLHRDQPMEPLDRAMFWIEFVMRHKGAAHLRTESYRMPWYSYYSVDVVGFFLAVVLFIAVTVIYSVKYLCRVICTGQKVKTN